MPGIGEIPVAWAIILWTSVTGRQNLVEVTCSRRDASTNAKSQIIGPEQINRSDAYAGESSIGAAIHATAWAWVRPEPNPLRQISVLNIVSDPTDNERWWQIFRRVTG